MRKRQGEIGILSPEFPINYTPGGANANPLQVYGGLSENNAVFENTVNLENGYITNDLYGGLSWNAAAYENTVNIRGGTAAQYVYGGQSFQADAYNNTVIVESGSVANSGDPSRSAVYGGYSIYGNATGNIATIKGAAIASSAYGGVAQNGGDATGNIVNIEGGTIDMAYGGVAWAFGPATGKATGNTINISGGTITDTALGGYVYAGDGDATNNTINVSGTPDLSAAWLVGGASSGTGNAVQGNTLNINGFSGAVSGIESFEKYNFTLPNGFTNGQTILTVDNAVDLTGTTITVADSVYDFGLGQGVTLIDKVTGSFASGTGIHSSVNIDKERTTFVTITNSLATYISKATHKTAVTASVAISVSPGSFGPVTDIYQAGLDMDGNNLSVASNANGATTFSVTGGLKASAVNLTQDTNDLIFTADALDVTTTDTSFVLNGTTATNATVTAATLANGRSLHIDNANGNMTISTLTVTGTGNSLEVSTNAQSITNLNANGAELIFVLPDAVAVNGADAVVTVTKANVTNATIGVVAKTALTLNSGDTINLLSASGGITGTVANDQATDNYNNIYDIYVSADNTLVAEVADLRSFEEIINDLFDGPGLNNGNLKNGATYLDELSQPGSLKDTNPALAQKIEDAFKSVTGMADVRLASFATQQFFGAYAAYGNQALSSDMNRFRRRWQGQNRSFFDTRLFGDLSIDSADAGVASPVYGARDTIACGQSRIWASGFGAWAKQNERSNLSGYKFDSQGAALGYEYTLGNLNLGIAAAYSRGDLKVNDLRYKNEAEILNLALYGAYIHESGFYAEGGLGYGHAWNDYKVHSIAVPDGVKKAKYGSDAFTADLELGYIARLPQDFNLIPSVGVEYTYLKNGNWTENVNNAALIANRFDSGHDHGVDIPLGIRFNKMFRFGCDGGFVVPEVRASYVYSASKSRPSITAGYAGAPGGAKMVGVDPGRSHWRIGAGVSGRLGSRVDFRLDYDFETRSGFKGHNLNASVGLSF